MIPTFESLGINRLTVAERITLVQQIWDSIEAEAEQAPLTEAQKHEIDRRLTAHETNPGAAIPWEQVEAEALTGLCQ